MEHENEGGGGEEKFDWKYWRGFEALNRQRKRGRESLMAEEREMAKYPLVGAHEDGRIFPCTMSLASWRRIENARRAGEETREAMRNSSARKDPPSAPQRKRPWQKPRSGGARSRRTAMAKAKAATEALEAAQGEAAAEESLRLTTEKELKKATSKLNKVRKVASNHTSWVRRPST